MAAARPCGRRPAGAQGWTLRNVVKCARRGPNQASHSATDTVPPPTQFRNRHRRTQGLTSRGGEGRPSSGDLQGANRIISDVRGGVCRRNPAPLSPACRIAPHLSAQASAAKFLRPNRLCILEVRRLHEGNASLSLKLDKELVGPVQVRDCMCFGKALKCPEICTQVPGAAK